MSDDEKAKLERDKLRAEIDKLESDVSAARGSQIRAWITAVSVSFGIVVTVFQVYQTLADIAMKNRQLAMESQIQSHQLFLNQVLDRMSGIKSVHNKVNEEGVLELESNETYGDVTQAGSYGAATALACEFSNLRFPAEVALTFQVAVQPKDIVAATMLERLNKQCPPGWNAMTGDERSSWIESIKPERSGLEAK